MSRPKTYDPEAIAPVVIEAMQIDVSPNKAIVELFGESRTRASYILSRLRDEGFLGAPPHHPVRAVARRGAETQLAWLACEACLHPWPCTDAFPYQ